MGLKLSAFGLVVCKLNGVVRSYGKLLVTSSDIVIHMKTTMKDVKNQVVAVSSDNSVGISNNRKVQSGQANQTAPHHKANTHACAYWTSSNHIQLTKHANKTQLHGPKGK